MSLEKMHDELNPPDDKCPYLCTVTIKLDFNKMLPSGDIAEGTVSLEKLEEHGISKNAVFDVFGFTLEDCILQTKKALEKLNE